MARKTDLDTVWGSIFPADGNEGHAIGPDIPAGNKKEAAEDHSLVDSTDSERGPVEVSTVQSPMEKSPADEKQDSAKRRKERDPLLEQKMAKLYSLVHSLQQELQSSNSFLGNLSGTQSLMQKTLDLGQSEIREELREGRLWMALAASIAILGMVVGTVVVWLAMRNDASAESPKRPQAEATGRLETGRLNFAVGKAFWRPFSKVEGATRAFVVSRNIDEGQEKQEKVAQFSGERLTVGVANRWKTKAFCLKVECNGFSVIVPFREDAEGSYSLAVDGDWEFHDVRLAFAKDDSGSLTVSGLRAGESIKIHGAERNELFRIQAQRDLDEVYLPFCSRMPVLYSISREIASGRELRHAYYNPLLRQLSFRSYANSNVSRETRIINETTLQSIDSGRLLALADPHTNEVYGYQFVVPPGPAVFSEFYPAAANSGKHRAGEIQFRPQQIRFDLDCRDNSSGQVLSEVSVTSLSRQVTYVSETNRLILPSPRESHHLDDVELIFGSKGFSSVTMSLQSVAQRISPKGVLRLDLARTHANVVLIWPTSRGMANELGPQHVDLGAALVRSLIEALSAQPFQKLGYETVDVYLLRDALERAEKDIGQLAYVDSDKPTAMVPYTANRNAYSIYRDVANPTLLGYHTVVIPCIPASTGFPTNLSNYSKLDAVLHVHGLAVSSSKDDIPFVSSFLQKSCDSHSILTVTVKDALATEAERVAQDIFQAVSERFGQPSPIQ